MQQDRGNRSPWKHTKKYSNLFCNDTKELVTINIGTREINTGNNPPVAKLPFRQNAKIDEDIEIETKKL